MVTNVTNNSSLIPPVLKELGSSIESSGLSLRVELAVVGALALIAFVYCSCKVHKLYKHNAVESSRQIEELSTFAQQLKENRIAVPSAEATKALGAAAAAFATPYDTGRQWGMLVAGILVNKGLPQDHYGEILGLAQQDMNHTDFENRTKACELLGVLVARGYKPAYGPAFIAGCHILSEENLRKKPSDEEAVRRMVNTGMYTLAQLVSQKHTPAYNHAVKQCNIVYRFRKENPDHEFLYQNEYYLPLVTSLVRAGVDSIYPLALGTVTQNEMAPNTLATRLQTLQLFMALESRGQLKDLNPRALAEKATRIGLKSVDVRERDVAGELSELLRGVVPPPSLPEETQWPPTYTLTLQQAKNHLHTLQKALLEDPSSPHYLTIHIKEEVAPAAPKPAEPASTSLELGLDEIELLLGHLDEVLARGVPALSSSVSQQEYDDAAYMKNVLERTRDLAQAQNASELPPPPMLKPTQSHYLQDQLSRMTPTPAPAPAASSGASSPQPGRRWTFTEEQARRLMDRLSTEASSTAGRQQPLPPHQEIRKKLETWLAEGATGAARPPLDLDIPASLSKYVRAVLKSDNKSKGIKSG